LPTARTWTRLAANKPLVLLVALVLALVLADAVWLSAYRHGGAMNIDEAGYLNMSLNDYRALRQGGLSGFVTTINAQPTQAPLVPALAALAFLVRGQPTFLSAFAVQLLAYIIVIVATYSMGSLIADRWVGLVSALAAASLPIMVHYIHDYSFAVPAAAAASVAIWAGLRADWMRLKRFAVVWGVALGAMLVARTMTIAFIPAFGLIAVLQVVASPQRKRSLIGVVCGLGAAVLVAGPWYLAQGYSVWKYLTSFGYGAASDRYGAARSLLSPMSWLSTARDNVNQHLWVPLAVVLVAGGVALVAMLTVRLVRRELPSARATIGSPWFYLAVVVAEGLLALQSSRNVGSAFLAPLLPAMLVLAVAGLARACMRRRRCLCIALGVVAALCLPSLITTTAFNAAAGQPVALDVPYLGSFNVVDLRDQYLAYASMQSELDLGDLRGAKWRRANDALMSAVDNATGGSAQMPFVFAFNHSLINANTLQWEELMYYGISPAIYLLSAAANGEAGYAAQLEGMLGSGHGVVLISSDPRGMFPPVLDQEAVRSSIAKAGFALSGLVPLPDGACVEVWVR
jgi:4-amino-4-deoxy-L-arabinose transferase-like glycosyltransferase